MKVCFISIGVYSLFNPECAYKHGGAEVKLYTLAKELAKDQRFDVNFITADFDQEALEEYGNIKVYKSSKLQGRGEDISLISYVFNFFYFYDTLINCTSVLLPTKLNRSFHSHENGNLIKFPSSLVRDSV